MNATSAHHNTKATSAPRPPVVVVVGHIDHGKSTLLDYIRKTSVTEGEQGGITQHISAYEAAVELEGKIHKITFLDTPGHEAFSSMRERGTSAADIAILVVSAEDGVKPQTIEAINCIKKSGMPMLVAINKIDKSNANINKTKQELAEKEILLEGWGGTVPACAISAKTGEGVKELLETLVLQAELEEISADYSLPASGFVIESKLDPKKGIETVLIIKNGTLRKGAFLASGKAWTPVRSIEDFKGTQIDEASAGQPIKIWGWNEVPRVGKEFYSSRDKQELLNLIAKKTQEEPVQENKKETVEENPIKKVPIIIKTDTIGSLEAITHELRKLDNDRIAIKIISGGAGFVNEADVKLAKSGSDILVVSFNTKVEPGARDLATRNNIEIKQFGIIYELSEWVAERMKELEPKEEVLEMKGSAKVLKIFSATKRSQVIGGRVEEGEIDAGSIVKILRRDAEIGEGRIKELQAQKIKTGSISQGTEFGALVESKIEIVPGDKLSSYQKVIK